MAPELDCSGGSDDFLCLSEEMVTKSIALVFISTFGAELDSREADDFDKDVLSDSKELVADFTFSADVACGDDRDGIFSIDDGLVTAVVMVVESSTCIVRTEVTHGDENNVISCFDEGIIEFIRFVATWSLDVELSFGDSSGCFSCFNKDLIESIKLAETFSLRVEIAFRDSSDCISCFDKEVLIESIKLAVTLSLGMELAIRDSSDCISCFDKEGLVESIRLVVTSSLGTELAFGGTSGCISRFDIEVLTESAWLVVTSSLDVELKCEDPND